MAESEPTKVCPLCAETIKAAAKICPHCQSWQKKWSIHNLRTRQTISAVISAVLIFAGMIAVGIFFDHLFGPKRDFAPYQKQIVVISSDMSFRMYNSNLVVSVVGVVTNESDFAWKNVGLEARLFDKNGKLIDVIQAGESSYDGITVLPHAEAGFKIQSKATKAESDYAIQKVFVGTGKDFSVWP